MTRLHRDPRVLRITTYNIHKCRGMDGRIRPARIAAVLRDIDADVIALQEVVRIDEPNPEADQMLYLAKELKMPHHAFGKNRKWRHGEYGNAVLSRVPISHAENFNLTWKKLESRGCQRVDLSWHGAPLHIFNAHLGTAFMERRWQAQQLLSKECVRNPALNGPRIVLGDFNEWTRGLCTRMLSGELVCVDLKPVLWRPRSYPGVFPLLHLDQIYFDRVLQLRHFTLHRNRAALIASDHLPLSADFVMPEAIAA